MNYSHCIYKIRGRYSREQTRQSLSYLLPTPDPHQLLISKFSRSVQLGTSACVACSPGPQPDPWTQSRPSRSESDPRLPRSQWLSPSLRPAARDAGGAASWTRREATQPKTAIASCSVRIKIRRELHVEYHRV